MAWGVKVLSRRAGVIRTGNNTGNAVRIEVNGVSGGVGEAKLGRIEFGITGGVLTVDAVRGGVVDNNGSGMNVVGWELDVKSKTGGRIGYAGGAVECGKLGCGERCNKGDRRLGCAGGLQRLEW